MPVLTDEAEQSTALLFRTLAAHKAAVLTFAAPHRGRLAPAKIDDLQFQERRQATLIRLMSIAESFASDLLWRAVDAETAVPPGTLVGGFVADAVIGSTSTWDAQEKAFKKWFKVEPDWKYIGYLADARNAAAHGLGQLTRRQLRNETSTVTKIKNANIAVIDKCIVLSEVNLEEATSWCRAFIEDLDLRVQTLNSTP